MVVIFCNRMVWVTERDIFFFTCWIRCFFFVDLSNVWCKLVVCSAKIFSLSFFFSSLLACVNRAPYSFESISRWDNGWYCPGRGVPDTNHYYAKWEKKISVSVNYWNTLTHTTPPYDFFSFFQQSKKFLTNYKIALKSPPCFIFFILLFFLLFYINQLTFYNSIN